MESKTNNNASSNQEVSNDVQVNRDLAQQNSKVEDIIANIAIMEHESCTITDFSHASDKHRQAWWKQEEQQS